MEELLLFKGQVESVTQAARRGNADATRYLGRLRRRVCALAFALEEGAYTPEQAAAVRLWIDELRPLLFPAPEQESGEGQG